jgi:hypothetical protein
MKKPTNSLNHLPQALAQYNATAQSEQAAQYVYAVNDPLEGDYLFSNRIEPLKIEVDSARKNGYPKAVVIRLSDRAIVYP